MAKCVIHLSIRKQCRQSQKLNFAIYLAGKGYFFTKKIVECSVDVAFVLTPVIASSRSVSIRSHHGPVGGCH